MDDQHKYSNQQQRYYEKHSRHGKDVETVDASELLRRENPVFREQVCIISAIFILLIAYGAGKRRELFISAPHGIKTQIDCKLIVRGYCFWIKEAHSDVCRYRGGCSDILDSYDFVSLCASLAEGFFFVKSVCFHAHLSLIDALSDGKREGIAHFCLRMILKVLF